MPAEHPATAPLPWAIEPGIQPATSYVLDANRTLVGVILDADAADRQADSESARPYSVGRQRSGQAPLDEARRCRDFSGHVSPAGTCARCGCHQTDPCREDAAGGYDPREFSRT